MQKINFVNVTVYVRIWSTFIVIWRNSSGDREVNLAGKVKEFIFGHHWCIQAMFHQTPHGGTHGGFGAPGSVKFHK